MTPVLTSDWSPGPSSAPPPSPPAASTTSRPSPSSRSRQVSWTLSLSHYLLHDLLHHLLLHRQHCVWLPAGAGGGGRQDGQGPAAAALRSADAGQ